MTKSARPTNNDRLATRERILAEAAVLFAKRGFHGTSTREIAEVVGVRQPSLFHHFRTKQDVLAELLDRDLGPALDLIRRVRSIEAGAAARLYIYLRTDVAALISFPFDARGIYNDDVLEEHGFEEQRRCRKAFHDEVRDLIADGVESGQFRDVDPRFAQQAINAMTKDAIFGIGAGFVPDLEVRPTEIADFILLGLLSDPSDLPGIRIEAEALVDGSST